MNRFISANIDSEDLDESLNLPYSQCRKDYLISELVHLCYNCLEEKKVFGECGAICTILASKVKERFTFTPRALFLENIV